MILILATHLVEQKSRTGCTAIGVELFFSRRHLVGYIKTFAYLPNGWSIGLGHWVERSLLLLVCTIGFAHANTSTSPSWLRRCFLYSMCAFVFVLKGFDDGGQLIPCPRHHIPAIIGHLGAMPKGRIGRGQYGHHGPFLLEYAILFISILL